MRTSKLVSLVLALTLVGVFASTQPSRTMGSLVQAAVSQGEAGKLGLRDSRFFKLEPNTPTKMVWYNQDAVDSHEHVFEVLLDKEGKPNAVLMQVSHLTENGSEAWLEGKDFLLTLDGKIKTAKEYSGLRGKLVEKKMSSSAAKKAFEHDKRFWFEETADKEFSK